MPVARRRPGNPKQGHLTEPDLKKQSQLIIVQCSAFSGQRQDKKK
jgi:hypothetical protein